MRDIVRQAPSGANKDESVLEVRQLSKAFAGVRAVDGVDLTIRRGERRAIIGPNGAGKTTLFNLVTGVLHVDAGRVTLLGHDVTRALVRSRANLGLGRTFQISSLMLELTVEENLVLASNSSKLPTPFKSWRSLAAVRERARSVAEQVGLSPRFNDLVKSLSHGEQRQLELALALAGDPQVIMLDEPAAGLSPTERQLVMHLIDALDPNLTVVLIEHDMDVVLNLMQSITVLHQGRVIAEGPPGTISNDTRVQEVYMGTL